MVHILFLHKILNCSHATSAEALFVKMVDITLAENPKKTGHIKENCIIYIEEFAENTSLHGVRYLVEKRSKCEKIWWLVMFAFLLYFCSGMVGEIYTKFDDGVVIISYDRKPTSVSEIPFPAITFCPETKTCPWDFNFTESYLKAWKSYNETDESIESNHLLDATAMICTSDYLEIYTKMNEFISNEAVIFMLEAAYRSPIAGCKWMSKYRCGHLFSEIITEDGLCYTFNMLPIRQILRDNYLLSETGNYTDYQPYYRWNQSILQTDEDAPDNVYPRRIIESGSNVFEFKLFEQKYFTDYLCNGPEMGYKVVVHNPRDFPNTFSDHFKLSFDKKYIFTIEPSLLTTSDILKGFSRKYRRCYHQFERRLQFFQYYSKKNCELECLTNYTLQLCGCVSFYMPRYIDTKICGPGKVNCLNIAREKHSSMQLKTDVYSAESKEEVTESINEVINVMCDCLPECDSLYYKSEFIQQDYLEEPVRQTIYRSLSLSNTSGEIHDKISSLTFKFKDMQFTKGSRKLLYGFADLLANCGGLFSLFTGFSLISLVEFVYFCTLRLCCNYRRYGLEQRKSK